MLIYILLSIFIILQLLDVCTTKRNILDKDGKEHWPPMKYLIDKFGFWRAIISSKVLTVIAISTASLYIKSVSELGVFILLCVLNLFYMAVIAFNSEKIKL